MPPVPPISTAWPVLLGAVLGVALGAVVLRGRRGRPGRLARVAAVTAAGSTCAFLAGWWVWLDSGLRLRQLYTWPDGGMQFLSNEEFHVLLLGEWTRWLTVIACVTTVVALTAWVLGGRRARGRTPR